MVANIFQLQRSSRLRRIYKQRYVCTFTAVVIMVFLKSVHFLKSDLTKSIVSSMFLEIETIVVGF